MDEIEETEKTKIKLSDICSARIMIRETRTGKKIVRVQISYTKKRRTNVELEFPEEIQDELCWKTYHGERIAVYHRKDANDYINIGHNILIPTKI